MAHGVVIALRDDALRHHRRSDLGGGRRPPRVELVLDRTLDNQPGPQPPAQTATRAGSRHPHGEQLVGPLLDLRRRRYGTSHGVGPPSSSLTGLEGTYAVALTAPAIYSASGTPPAHARAFALTGSRTLAPDTWYPTEGDGLEPLRARAFAWRSRELERAAGFALDIAWPVRRSGP
jgi:hypothetical protein